MTKEEVLAGALLLNEKYDTYNFSVDGDRIILTAKYDTYATGIRKSTFRCIAVLNDDNTYVELHEDHDKGRSSYGKAVKVQKSISFTFGGKGDGVEIEKNEFSSEDCKKILRDYLESCDYKRTNKGFFKRLFGK